MTENLQFDTFHKMLGYFISYTNYINISNQSILKTFTEKKTKIKDISFFTQSHLYDCRKLIIQQIVLPPFCEREIKYPFRVIVFLVVFV